MPDRLYSLETVAPSAAKFVSDMDAIKRKLLELEAITDRLEPKLKGIGVGSTRSVNSLGKSLDGVTANAKAATVALSATAAAANQLRAASGRVTVSTNAAGASMGRLVGYSAGLTVLHQGVRLFADAMNDARDYAERTAGIVHKISDDVRELRAIKGDDVTTRDAVRGVADLMIKTGAKADQAISFEKMFESALPAAQQNVDEKTGKPTWQLDAAQTQRVKEEALKFAVSQQIDPAVMGRIIPAIGLSGTVNTPEDVMGQMSAMHSLAVQGVGTFTPIMKVFNKLRGTMVRPGGGGAAKSPAELMGIISAGTVTAGTETQVTRDINQVWRELSKADNDAKAHTLAGLGIVPGQDDFVSSVEKMAPLIEAARARGESELTAMANAGFKNGDANLKILAAVKNRSVLRQRADAGAKGGDPGRVAAINERFREQNPQRFADARLAVAEMRRGDLMADLVTLRTNAEAGLTHPRNMELNTPGHDLTEAFITATRLGGIAGEKGRQSHLDTEVRARLRAAVPGIDKQFPQLGGGPGGNEAEGDELAAILNSLSKKDRAAVFRESEGFGTTGNRSEPRSFRNQPSLFGIPFVRPGSVGGGVLGPRASNDQAGGGDALADINRDQLRVLERIDRKLGAGGGEVAFNGGLPIDGGDFGPRRAGA